MTSHVAVLFFLIGGSMCRDVQERQSVLLYEPCVTKGMTDVLSQCLCRDVQERKSVLGYEPCVIKGLTDVLSQCSKFKYPSKYSTSIQVSFKYHSFTTSVW